MTRCSTAAHGASTNEVATVTACVPPTPGAFQVVGVTTKVAVPPACVTSTVWPAIVACAVRAATEVVAAAVRVTAPVPAPEAGLTVSQGWSVVAVQGRSDTEVMIVTSCVPCTAGAFQVLGATTTSSAQALEVKNCSPAAVDWPAASKTRATMLK